MKYLFLSIGLAASACQPQARTKRAASAEAPVLPVASVAAAPGPVAVSALSPQLRAGLQATDLSSVLQTVRQGSAFSQDGFFGPDHYRIEVAFTDVRRDPARPTVYYLRGQDRYKGTITPFAGTFIIDRFGEQPYFTARDITEMRKRGGVLANYPGFYTASGTFELREDSTRHGAGVFRGRLAVDWFTEKDGSLTLNCRDNTGASQGGLIKYEGTWTNAATHRTYPVVWVQDILAYNAVKDVLKEFNVGERDVVINPKYARLGWNTYWENDEWWATAKHSPAAAQAPSQSLSAAPVAAADSALARQ